MEHTPDSKKQISLPRFTARLCFFSLLFGGLFIGLEQCLALYSGWRADRIAAEPLGEPFERLLPLHHRLGTPERGSWLAEKFEPGQSVAEFAAAAVKRSEKRLTIAIQGLEPLSAASLQLLPDLREYLEIFFCAQVRVLTVLPASKVPEQARRRREQPIGLQYHTEPILARVSPTIRPKDAALHLLLTDRDIFPRSDWGFVFGQANPKNSAAIVSLARFGSLDGSPEAYRRVLRRLLQTAAHELSHALGMYHCVTHECLMNGSMSLEQSDRQPLHVCPICLKKHSLAASCDPQQRFARLSAYTRARGLTQEAAFFRLFLEQLR